MKRTASLNLDWKRDYEWNEWYANLPAIPGYPGTQTEGNAQIAVYSVKDGYCFEIIVVNAYDLPVTDGDHIYLYNSDFGIPDTETEDEMMDIVEERLTPEMIADALQAKGYTPGGIATAARKAAKRTASLNLDWEKCSNWRGAYYVAELPDVPGYMAPGYITRAIVRGSVDDPDLWTFLIQVGGINDGQESAPVTAKLNNDDFGIPDGDSAEEMMQAVDNLSMDDIIFVLRQNGFLTVDENGWPYN